MQRGSLYLVAIMDWYGRKVLSWRLSNSMDAGFCVDALKEAIATYGKPEMVNSDQGSQFTGQDMDRDTEGCGYNDIDGRKRSLD